MGLTSEYQQTERWGEQNASNEYITPICDFVFDRAIVQVETALKHFVPRVGTTNTEVRDENGSFLHRPTVTGYASKLVNFTRSETAGTELGQAIEKRGKAGKTRKTGENGKTWKTREPGETGKTGQIGETGQKGEKGETGETWEDWEEWEGWRDCRGKLDLTYEAYSQVWRTNSQ